MVNAGHLVQNGDALQAPLQPGVVPPVPPAVPGVAGIVLLQQFLVFALSAQPLRLAADVRAGMEAWRMERTMFTLVEPWLTIPPAADGNCGCLPAGA